MVTRTVYFGKIINPTLSLDSEGVPVIIIIIPPPKEQFAYSELNMNHLRSIMKVFQLSDRGYDSLLGVGWSAFMHQNVFGKPLLLLFRTSISALFNLH